MAEIVVEHHPSEDRLNQLGVTSWPVWTKEISVFPWTYSEQEIAYILAGEVVLTPKDGGAVSFGAGDLVIFPAGLICTWEIKKALRKHYSFG